MADVTHIPGPLHDIDPVDSIYYLTMEDQLEEAILCWREDQEVMDSTQRVYESCLRRYFLFLKEVEVKFSQSDRRTVIKYKKYMQDEGFKPNSQYNYYQSVSQFYKWCEMRSIYQNITKSLKAPKKSEDYTKDEFTQEEVSTMIASCDTSTPTGRRDYAVLLLLFTTGLRRAEAVSISIEDITTVQNPVTEDWMRVARVKRKKRVEKDALVRIEPILYTALEAHWADRRRKDGAGPETGIIATLKRGGDGRMADKTINRIVKARMEAIGLVDKRKTAHSTRHTFATECLLRTGNPSLLLGLLNVKSQQTVQRYTNRLSSRMGLYSLGNQSLLDPRPSIHENIAIQSIKKNEERLPADGSPILEILDHSALPE